MPVGTQATIKTLHPDEVRATGADIVLANTYHLMLRPGVDVIDAAGGLHEFMQWANPILTDSGGFQVFSLGTNVKVREDGVVFQSHIDGARHELTPESAVDLQALLGSDIMMQLDHLVGLPSNPRKVAEAAARSSRWLTRSIEAHNQSDRPRKGALFGIVQGGADVELRRESAEFVAVSSVSGCAIGGLSVGESKETMAEIIEFVTGILPVEKPRYLMGVGSPEDLWNGVALGVDMFDCVLPTRVARNGALFTPQGRIDITSKRFERIFEPVDSTCDCDACTRFTAAYLHHLFRAREILGLRLASVHNLRFLASQMETMRTAIASGCFESAHRDFINRYRPVGSSDLKALQEGKNRPV